MFINFSVFYIYGVPFCQWRCPICLQRLLKGGLSTYWVIEMASSILWLVHLCFLSPVRCSKEVRLYGNVTSRELRHWDDPINCCRKQIFSVPFYCVTLFGRTIPVNEGHSLILPLPACRSVTERGAQLPPVYSEWWINLDLCKCEGMLQVRLCLYVLAAWHFPPFHSEGSSGCCGAARSWVLFNYLLLENCWECN